MKSLISVGIAAVVLVSIYAFFEYISKPNQDTKTVSKKVNASPLLLDQDDAKTVLSKCMTAHGGKEALDRWHCGHVQYLASGELFRTGQMKNVVFQDTFQFPDYFKRTVNFELAGKPEEMTFVVNQQNKWVRNSGPSLKALSSFQTSLQEHPLKVLIDFSFLSSVQPFLLARLPNKVINHEETADIIYKTDGLGVHFYFDLYTGLLLATSKAMPIENSAKTKLLMTSYDSYRDVQGYPFPMEISTKQDNHEILTLKIRQLSFSDQYEASEFAKP
ncbi:MAG: hypothetical protein U0798_08090 [Gemmataceae bacterium]